MRVLAIVHGPDSRAWLFGDAVCEGGHELDERSYAFGSPPVEPERYDAVMVFGGSMNVHEVDGHPWLRDEHRGIERALEAGVPLLGVCLGSQLLASVAGAKVLRAPEPEIGWYDVQTTGEAADDPLFARVPDTFRAFEWHSYQFELPSGSTLLAHSPVCFQAYRLGETAWGTQFHAEVTREVAHDWIDVYGTDPDAVRIGFDPESERERLNEEIGRWNEIGRALIDGFLETAEARMGLTASPAHA